MGHRQQMTAKQRLDWDIRNYVLRKEANKGHNHSYMTDVLYEQLKEKGYTAYEFIDGFEIKSELIAITKRDELRKQGHYARIVSTANRLRIRYYEVYYKGRMILDPEADGKQWLYRGIGICEQKHPRLLPYVCYDWDRCSFRVGVATSKKNAMELIDKYILEGGTTVNGISTL